MPAANVSVSRRFQRAVRIDADFGTTAALVDYVAMPTSVGALERMSAQVGKSKQRAYTWTGPYGGGKSSLAIVLGSLLDSDKAVRDAAQAAIGKSCSRQIQTGFGLGKGGWLVVPVVGSANDVVREIDEALSRALRRRFGGRVPKNLAQAVGSSSAALIGRVSRCADLLSAQRDGVLIIIDEMGKFLEGSAGNSGDIFFFQELAEKMGRLDAKVVVVGILHQAFEQYASRLGHGAREEWAKIQGRYVDIPLATGPEEALSLLAQALVAPHPSRNHIGAAERIFAAVRERRASASKVLLKALTDCFPLHPSVALILAALSRRRFGQNERSTFGFLCSGEPNGFQDFLGGNFSNESYLLDQLWDY